MTQIIILSGFLGAGKTTLIRRLAETCWQGKKVVLVENEFGEVGVDGPFLQRTGLEIRELTSGCICCSLVGDFTGALCDIAERLSPDIIAIEPSGVAKLSEILRAARQSAEKAPLTLSCAVTVCDAGLCRDYAEGFGEFYLDQARHADLILMSHADETDAETLRDAARYLAQHGPAADIIAAPWQELGPAALRGLLEAAAEKRRAREAVHDQADGQDRCHDHHHHEHDRHRHDAGQTFVSWSRRPTACYTEDALRRLAHEVSSGRYGRVLRVKGIAPTPAGDWLELDCTGGHIDIRSGCPQPEGVLCVIGAQLDEGALDALIEKPDK